MGTSWIGLGPSSRRRRGILAIPLSLALLVAACGSDDDDDGATGGSTATTAAAQDGDSAPVDRDLTVAIPAVPSTLDPAKYEGKATDYTYINTNSTLVRYERKPAEEGKLAGPTEVEGELAESWTVNDDGSVTFTLREAQSQFGRTLTAEDVKWSVERAIANSSTVQFVGPLMARIDVDNPVTVVDERTVTLNTTGFSSFLVPFLASYYVAILDSVEAQEHATPDDPWASEWLASNTATFGPYQLASFEPTVRLELERNPNYWGEPPAVSSVLFQAVPEASTRLSVVKAGEVDITFPLTYAQLEEVGQGGDPTTVGGLSPSTISLITYDDRPPFDDARVRNAVSAAIDREALIAGGFSGVGEPQRAQIPSFMPVPDGAELEAEHTTYDPEKARELLAEAGYDEDNPLRFQLAINPSIGPGPNATDVATILQQQLADVGVEIEVITVGAEAEFSSAVFGAQYDSILFALNSLIQDPAYLIRLLWTDGGPKRFGYFKNEELNALSEQIVGMEYGPERDEVLAQQIEIINDELPTIPLVEEPLPWVVRAGIKMPASYPLTGFYVQDVQFED